MINAWFENIVYGEYLVHSLVYSKNSISAGQEL